MSARTLMAEREQARPKVNDYLLAQAVAAHENYKKSKIQKKGKQTSSFLHQTSDISVAAVPVYLQSVSNLCNQLLRSGTSIGAKTRTCSLIPVGS